MLLMSVSDECFSHFKCSSQFMVKTDLNWENWERSLSLVITPSPTPNPYYNK